MTDLFENERIDDLGRRGYRIIQNRTKFCFGIDATFLAWFARVRDQEKVLDLCSGTGIVPILMDARYAKGQYTGLEIQANMVAMANRSAQMNGIDDHLHFEQGDLKEASDRFGKSSFDVVTVNPPYMPRESGLLNPDSDRAIARHEILCTLDDVIREAAALLHPNGRFYMVHRPARLPGILAKMRENHLAPGRLCLIYPYQDKEAAMVLVAGTKDGRDLLHVEPPVIIYEKPNVYTDQVLHIYQDNDDTE